jgi:nucleoside phosphorylase
MLRPTIQNAVFSEEAMKRAVLAVAAAFAIVAAPLAAFAQEGGGPPPPPPPQDLQIDLQQPAKVDAKALAKQAEAATAKIPAMIAQTKVTCTVTEKRFIGSFNTSANGKKANFEATEASCSEGLGYIFAAYEKNGPVNAIDCISQYSQRRGDKDPLTCTLPGNTHL